MGREGLVDRSDEGDKGDEGSSVEWQCAPQFVLWLVASGWWLVAGEGGAGGRVSAAAASRNGRRGARRHVRGPRASSAGRRVGRGRGSEWERLRHRSTSPQGGGAAAGAGQERRRRACGVYCSTENKRQQLATSSSSSQVPGAMCRCSRSAAGCDATVDRRAGGSIGASGRYRVSLISA
jgi:hypothetical protein